MPIELIILKSEFKNSKIIVKEVHDTLGFIIFYNGIDLKLYRNHCPHMGAKLEAKHICSERDSLICPWHVYKFDLQSGDLIENPGIKNWIEPLVSSESHFLKLRNMKLISYPIEEKPDYFRILVHEA